MTTLSIDLPEELIAFAHAEAKRRHCSPGEFLARLVDDAKQRCESDEYRLRALYLGLIEHEMAEGGIGTKSIDDIIAEGRARHERRERHKTG